MITAQGLGSGIDVGGLVSQLVASERAGSDLKLSRETSKLNAKLSALGSLKGVISGFQGSLSGLNNLSSFDKKSAITSNPNAVSVIAKSASVPNAYSIEVQQLSDFHSLASGAFADSDQTEIGTGTLTFRTGTVNYNTGTDTVDAFTLKPDSKVTTITIDSSNNTLNGIMTAVNDANFGVQASIVNDGSGDRLLFTSKLTGAENAIEIATSDDDANDTDNSGLSRLAFNTSASHVTQTRAAKDAEFTVNGLAVTSTENSVTSAIPGVTLDLKTVTTDPVTVTIAKSSSSVVAALNSFLSGYNQFANTVKGLTQYNPATNTAGTLIGDFSVRAIVSQVDDIMRNAVDGLTAEFGSLAAVGITTNINGNYELDTTKFQALLDTNPTAVKSLFTAMGIPTDSDIAYSKSSDATLTGDYAVNISSVATSGLYTGASVLPADFGATPLVIDSSNNSITFEIDGLDIGEILLTEGSYNDGDVLATEIQARINGTEAMVEAGKNVEVAYDSGSSSFIITSDSIGNASAVNITAVGANTAAQLGFSIADGVDGLDVIGTINGNTATGAGKLLTADSGSDAEGLQLEINGSATGDRGAVKFTRGVTDQLRLLLAQILEDESSLNTRIDNVSTNLEKAADRKAALELRWQAVQERYSRQFNALDTMLAGLQSTSAYLETQLASLPGVTRKN